MPSVYNKRHGDAPVNSVYIGRPTKWGNPFSHVPGTLAEYTVASREEAVAMYEKWIQDNPTLIQQAKQELKGKNLVCWCKPAACHGDVLLRIANESESTVA